MNKPDVNGFERFVFIASLGALFFLGWSSWYRKHVILPEEKKIIENSAYKRIQHLEKENDNLKVEIDSLRKIIHEKK